jgi:hypothetical protein
MLCVLLPSWLPWLMRQAMRSWLLLSEDRSVVCTRSPVSKGCQAKGDLLTDSLGLSAASAAAACAVMLHAARCRSWCQDP